MILPKCWHALGRGAGPELVIYSSSMMSATHDRMALSNKLPESWLAAGAAVTFIGAKLIERAHPPCVAAAYRSQCSPIAGIQTETLQKA
jgi:hypothetical protein